MIMMMMMMMMMMMIMIMMVWKDDVLTLLCERPHVRVLRLSRLDKPTSGVSTTQKTMLK